MNITVKVFKIFAAMSDHRSRERGERCRRNFDRTGCKKLVMWEHEENVQHRTLLRKLRRGRRPTSNAECRWRSYFSMTLTSPLRSTRPFFTLETSSSCKLRRMCSSTSWVELSLRCIVFMTKSPSSLIISGRPCISQPTHCECYEMNASG